MAPPPGHKKPRLSNNYCIDLTLSGARFILSRVGLQAHFCRYSKQIICRFILICCIHKERILLRPKNMLIFLWEFTISAPSKRVLEKLRRLANKVNYFKYSLARTTKIKIVGFQTALHPKLQPPHRFFVVHNSHILPKLGGKKNGTPPNNTRWKQGYPRLNSFFNYKTKVKPAGAGAGAVVCRN